MAANLIRFAALVGIVLLMFSEGLHIERGELRFVLRRPGLAARSVLASVVLVPAAAWVCAVVFRPPAPVQVGLAILAASPLCPFVFEKIARAEGDRVFARSLHVVLAIVAIVSTPLALAGLGRSLALPLHFPVFRTAIQVLLTVLAPILAGVVTYRFSPKRAARVREPLEKVALGAIVLAFVPVLTLRIRVFTELGPGGYLAFVGMVILSLAIGHTLAGRDERRRTTLALESAARNPGLALAIAAVDFPGAHPAAVLLPWLAVFVLVTGLYGAVRRRTTTSARALRPPAR